LKTKALPMISEILGKFPLGVGIGVGIGVGEKHSAAAASPLELDFQPALIETRNGDHVATTEKPKRGVLTKTQSAWFDAWWSVVWAKTARGDAEKAFAKAITSLDVFTRVMEATKVQTPVIRQRERRFWPHPATWLNGQRWLDELSQEPEFDREEESIRFVPKPRPVSTEPDEPMDLSWLEKDLPAGKAVKQ
jgi:hypothetical protein